MTTKTTEHKQRIVVRDRRTKHQFSIHNRIIDEWLPIIGLTGYALYSLYVRMASRESECCYPGYSLISQHLGVGRSTISNYNSLLERCGLIHIHRYEDGRHPNEYYILDIPAVTPELLDEIRRRIEQHDECAFRRNIIARLDNWRSLQSLWVRGDDRPVVVHPAQLSLPLEGSPVGEHPSPVGEHPSPVGEHPSPVGEHGVRVQDSNNPKQQSKTTIQREQSTPTTVGEGPGGGVVGDVLSLLSNFGIQEPIRSQLAGDGADPAAAQAWIWYARAQENLRDPTGFVVKQLQKHVAPPADLLNLARIVQQLDDEDLDILREYAADRRAVGQSAWRPLLHGDDGDERLAGLFRDVDTLELWYTHVYNQPKPERRP